MSKLPPDSDLYSDIYGDADDFTEIVTGDIQELQETVPEVSPEPAESTIASASNSKPNFPQTASNSLPAKPLNSTTASNLSYSAHVAKQFSAYRQTPSQERQQRRVDGGTLSSNPRATNASRNSAALVGGDASSSVKAAVTAGSDDAVFGKKPSEMHDAGKIFVGGLSWDTTDEGLRDYFSQFGKVDACTIMRDPSGTSRGFAFLTFEDASAVDAVVGSEHFLDGKNIDPKRAIPREEHLRNTRYFVGGLSPTTTSDSMRRFFSTYGKVVDATVMIDRETGRGKGFGFVTFEDAVNSDQLVGKIGLVLDDKQIEVKAAQPRSQRDQARAASSSNVVSEQSMDPAMLATPPGNFVNQPNPGLAMFNQRFLNNMPLALMNPGMMGMGSMNALNMGHNMLPGVNPMGLGMDGMFNLGNLTSMRLGMGPIGNLGMGGVIPAFLRNNSQTGMWPGGVGNLGGMGGLPATGPTRTMRGHNSFHPYAR